MKLSRLSHHAALFAIVSLQSPIESFGQGDVHNDANRKCTELTQADRLAQTAQIVRPGFCTFANDQYERRTLATGFSTAKLTFKLACLAIPWMVVPHWQARSMQVQARQERNSTVAAM